MIKVMPLFSHKSKSLMPMINGFVYRSFCFTGSQHARLLSASISATHMYSFTIRSVSSSNERVSSS